MWGPLSGGAEPLPYGGPAAASRMILCDRVERIIPIAEQLRLVRGQAAAGLGARWQLTQARVDEHGQ